MIDAVSEAFPAVRLPAGRGHCGQTLHYHFVRTLFETEHERLGIGRHIHRFHRNPGIMTQVNAKRNPSAGTPGSVDPSGPNASGVR